MKKLFYILFLLSAGLFAQTPPPHVLNTAGGTYTVTGGNYYGFNIGEPIVGTGHNGNGSNYYTQGFLQPDYQIGTAFGANVYVFGESCKGSGDGYLVANPFNASGPVSYTLNPASPSTYSATPITNLSPGNYVLTVQDSAGNYVVKNVIIQPSTQECEDTVYHAFSPNADGLNDLFIISGITRFPENHVYIFNRWGQLVWDREKYDNVKVVWDGKDNKDVPLTAGTYFYLINHKAGSKPKKSWVELTR